MKNPTYMLAWTMIALVFTALPSHAQSNYEPYTFTTFAGKAPFSSADEAGECRGA